MLFLFDMGEVVIKNVRTLDKIAARYGLDYKELRGDYGLYDRALMEGFMEPEDYYRHMEIRYGIDIREDLFRTAFTPVLNEFMIGIADKLRASGHRTAVASNTFRPHWDYILSMEDSPASHFDALYASHLIQRAKPECYFFEYIMQEEGFSAGETAFIDDRIDNIEAAESLGITVYNYLGDDDDAAAFFCRYIS